MKACRGGEVNRHAFLASLLNGGSHSVDLALGVWRKERFLYPAETEPAYRVAVPTELSMCTPSYVTQAPRPTYSDNEILSSVVRYGHCRSRGIAYRVSDIISARW